MADNNSILEQLKADNPFMSLASPLPWENNTPDLLQLNGAVSTEIEQIIRNKRRDPSLPLAGLIFGIGGTGKTHMLTRILRRLRNNAWHVIFVTVRAFTNPKRVMQELLSEIFISLTRPHSEGRSQFDMLMDELTSAYQEHRREDGFTTDNMPEMKTHLKRDLPGIDRNFLKCLLLYLSTEDNAVKYDILEWLRVGLDDDDSQRLGLPLRDVSSMEDVECESSAKTIITSLGSVLAYAHIPMIICFDELDPMRSNKELIEAWGDTVAFLMNNISGILPLCFVKYDIWDDFFRSVLNVSIVQRLQGGEMTMTGCTIEQAKQLIHDRIAARFTDGVEEKYNLMMSRMGSALREGLSPRDVILLARNALRDNLPDNPIKEAYDDEYKKVQAVPHAWLPNSGHLNLALTAWLSARSDCKLLGVWRKYAQLFGTCGHKHFAFIAVTPKSAATATAAINEGIKFLEKYPDGFCCYVKDNRSHKLSWKVFGQRCDEFVRLGGRIAVLDGDTRSAWYALASLVNQLNSGNVNVYDASGVRPATLTDAQGFLYSLDLVPGLFDAGISKPEPTASPEPAAPMPDIKPALTSIIDSSPMKLITVDKALNLLAAKGFTVSREELLSFVSADKLTFRVYPAKSGSDVMLALNTKA